MKKTLAYILGAMMILGLISWGTAFAAEEAPLYTYGQYDVTYLPGTTDNVTNMPANETGLTPGSDNPYTVSSTVPQREGFEFIDWGELTWGTMEKPATYAVTYVVNDDPTYGAPEDSVTPVDENSPYEYMAQVTVKDNLTTTQTYATVDGKQVPGTWAFTPWDKEDFQITEDTTITGSWHFAPYIYYTVRYLEVNTDKVLAPEKVVKDLEAGKMVTEEAIDIPQYRLVGDYTQTLVLDVGENVITFYYEKHMLTAYTVKYLDVDSGEPISTDKIVRDVEPGAEITEVAIPIPGYNALAPTEITMVMEESGNVFIFYYEPVDYSDALTVSKKATAAAAGDANTARAYTITLEAEVYINADNPTGLFVENLTITDTIEDEFVLNSARAEILDSAGSVVSSNTVSAAGQIVTHDFENVEHGQTARLILEVTAQTDYIGSNGVYTNVGLSGWTYKHTEPGATAAEDYSVSCADKPQVNVPIVFSVNERGQDEVNVISLVATFDGKNIPIPAHNAAKKYDQTSGTFSYEWDLFHSEGTAKSEDWGAWYHEHSWPAYPHFPQDYPGLDEIQWPDVDYNYTFAANIPVADTIHINNGRPDVSEEALSAMVSTNWYIPNLQTLGRYKVVLHVTFTPDAVAGEGVFADATTAEPVTADTKDGYLIFTLLPVRSSIDIEPDF